MEASVVVESCAPQHRSVRHHASRNIFGFNVVAGIAGTCFRDHTQIAWIDKPNELPALPCQQSIRPLWIRTRVLSVSAPGCRKARLYVSKLLYPLYILRVVTSLRRNGITTMAAGATKADRVFSIFELVECSSCAVLEHRLNESVTRNAAFDFCLGSGLLSSSCVRS